jgi:hypothetical protein
VPRLLCLDAIVIGAPGDDALLDGFGFEVLGKGLVDESGKLGVGGETEGDELADGELVDVLPLGGWEESGEAEAFFEADDTILDLECCGAGSAGHQEEDDCHDNPPEMRVLVCGPPVDGDVDGEDQVEQKEWEEGEVEEGIEAGVVLEGLRSGHGASFRVVLRREPA